MGSPQRETTHRPSRALGRGYLVAVGGITLFVVCVLAGAFLAVEGPAAGVLMLGSFGLMGIAFWAGTTIVAVDKGYPWPVGFALGLFAPLGLLVLTLMPMRGPKSRHP